MEVRLTMLYQAHKLIFFCWVLNYPDIFLHGTVKQNCGSPLDNWPYKTSYRLSKSCRKLLEFRRTLLLNPQVCHLILIKINISPYSVSCLAWANFCKLEALGEREQVKIKYIAQCTALIVEMMLVGEKILQC